MGKILKSNLDADAVSGSGEWVAGSHESVWVLSTHFRSDRVASTSPPLKRQPSTSTPTAHPPQSDLRPPRKRKGDCRANAV